MNWLKKLFKKKEEPKWQDPVQDIPTCYFTAKRSANVPTVDRVDPSDDPASIDFLGSRRSGKSNNTDSGSLDSSSSD